MHVVGYHDGIWLPFSTVVLIIMICTVDAQYSGVFKRKNSEQLVLTNDLHHRHHDNLPY